MLLGSHACSSVAPAVDGGSEPGFDPVGAAGAMITAIERQEMPAGTAGVIVALERVIAAEGDTGRARQAAVAAATLLAARFAQGRVPADLARADALLDRLAAMGGAAPAERCTALAAGAHWRLRAQRPEEARRRLLEFERDCSHDPALPNVHATLALLDPASASAQADAAAAPRRRHAGAIRRVVIDPGHGGSDPGARGPHGLSESHVALDVARRLADALARDYGIDVVLTRDADQYVALAERASRANAAAADLFLSIHCNSSENPAARGVSTYVLDTSNDAIAARVARREEGSIASEVVADREVFRILAGLRLGGEGVRSMRIAGAIQRALLDGLSPWYPDTTDLGVHPARFHVLVGARMPAVLVELSFVSNPIEESRLRQPGFRDRVARAIARAVGASAADAAQ